MEHFVTLQTAERLKDRGFPQEGSGFYYSFLAGDETGHIRGEFFFSKPQDQFNPIYAPVASELLPPMWVLVKVFDTWATYKINAIGARVSDIIDNESAPEAAAAAWLRVMI